MDVLRPDHRIGAVPTGHDSGMQRIGNLHFFPEINAISTSAQHQTDGRRAGLKIRSSQEGVGSSPTFGTDFGHSFSTMRTPF
jgi:hypothetical protein